MKRIAPSLLAALPIALTACHPPVAKTPPPWLDAKAQEQAAASAPGAEKTGQVYRGVYTGRGDKETDWNLALDPANCYWFSGVGDEGVKELYLYAWDPKDSRVATVKNHSSMNILMLCPETPGMYRVEAKVDEGRGHFEVAVYSKPAPPKAAPPPPPPPEPAEDLGAVIDKQASAAAPGAKRSGELFDGSTEHGASSQWSVMLESGNCYWFIGAGGKGVKKLWLYLWDPKNSRVVDTKPDSSMSVMGHCPKETGMFKFEAKVDSGSGKFKLGVFTKPSK
jgi:hypothetical protein